MFGRGAIKPLRHPPPLTAYTCSAEAQINPQTGDLTASLRWLCAGDEVLKVLWVRQVVPIEVPL